MAEMIEIIAQDDNKCGEAPIWDADRRRVLWTDNESETTYQYHADTGVRETLSTGLTVCAIALNRTGELVFAAAGVHLWRRQGDYQTLVTEYEGEALSFNDALADRAGRLYAGTLHWGPGGMEKFGRLYLIDTDASIRVVDEGIELANGLGFSPDDLTLYFTDSSVRKIYAYDVDGGSGGLSNRRVFAQVPDDEGIPDGLTVDAEGFVWSAQWFGSQIVRYDPDGKVERRIAMPMKQVSSLAFGGMDLTDLYVTTAGHAWPSDLEPRGYDRTTPNVGGPLYRVRTGVRGTLEHKTNFAWGD